MMRAVGRSLSSSSQQQNVPKYFDVLPYPPMKVRVHPVVVVTILDAYLRREEGQHIVIGTLLGTVSEGNVVDISDCFVDRHSLTEEGLLQIIRDHHETMYELKQQVSGGSSGGASGTVGGSNSGAAGGKEVVVGWFCTGSEMTELTCAIHGWFKQFSSVSKFYPQPPLTEPLHLMVNTTMDKGQLAIKTGNKASIENVEAKLSARASASKVERSYLLFRECLFASNMLYKSVRGSTRVQSIDTVADVEAYTQVPMAMAKEACFQFHELPLELFSACADRAGLSLLLKVREASRRYRQQQQLEAGGNPRSLGGAGGAAAGNVWGGAAAVASLSATPPAPGVPVVKQGLEAALEKLAEQLSKCAQYVRSVVRDSERPDPDIGRYMSKAVCMETVSDVDVFEQMCQNALQDQLMVVYLTNLARLQFAVAERLNTSFF